MTTVLLRGARVRLLRILAAVAVLCAAAAAVSACGQKGPLLLPQPANPADQDTNGGGTAETTDGTAREPDEESGNAPDNREEPAEN